MGRSITPLTLRRIIEVADLASRGHSIDNELVSGKLGVRERRATQILLELAEMGLLSKMENRFLATEAAHRLLDCYEREDWHGVHKILYDQNAFYRLLIDTLSKSSLALTKGELLEKLSNVDDLSFNSAAIDVVCDWAERLESVQRNLYTNRYYLISESGPPDFALQIERCYDNLNIKLRPNVRLDYVEISRLREDACEILRMARTAFDGNFESMLRSRVGEIDLCGGPVTTTAKRIPSTLKKIERNGKSPVLSPRYSVVKEGKGLEISGRVYHYVAIFRGGEQDGMPYTR